MQFNSGEKRKSTSSRETHGGQSAFSRVFNTIAGVMRYKIFKSKDKNVSTSLQGNNMEASSLRYSCSSRENTSVDDYNNRQLFNSGAPVSLSSTSSCKNDVECCPVCSHENNSNSTYCRQCKRNFNAPMKPSVFYGRSALRGGLTKTPQFRKSLHDRAAESVQEKNPDCITIMDEDGNSRQKPLANASSFQEVIEDVKIDDTDGDSASETPIKVIEEEPIPAMNIDRSPVKEFDLKNEETPMEYTNGDAIMAPVPFEIYAKCVYFGCLSCSSITIHITPEAIKFLNVPSSKAESSCCRYNIMIPQTEINDAYIATSADSALLLIRVASEAAEKIETALVLHKSMLYHVSGNKQGNLRFIVVHFVSNNVDELQRCVNDKRSMPFTPMKFKDAVKLAKDEVSDNKDDTSTSNIRKCSLRSNSKSQATIIDLDDGHCSEESLSKETHHFILSYPPNEKDAVAINETDLECLKEGEYLNDTILDFYLKYIWKELIDPTVRSSVHIFSTFFYGKLCKHSKNPEEKSKPIPQRYYDRVKRWTKAVDLFDYDFIVIPINKNYHWFVAILCYPSMVPEESEVIPKVNLAQDKRPCIIYMDSLGVAGGKNRLSEPIRYFLSMEWETKKGTKKSFSRPVLPDYFPYVPCQTNSSDCGLYVLQYIEEFLKDPGYVLERLLKKGDLEEWFSMSVIKTKRKDIGRLITKLKRTQECGEAAAVSDCASTFTRDHELENKYGSAFLETGIGKNDSSSSVSDTLPDVISDVDDVECDEDNIRKKQKVINEIN